LLLAAFGDPGHAFPMIALGRALVARGHDVTLQTWERWREPAQAEGMRFEPAPEYRVFPTREHPLKPYEAAARAALEMAPVLAELRPDAVVADILTLGPALGAEVAGVPVATLVPHVHPGGSDGFPPYSLGARLPRGAVGRAVWRGLAPAVAAGLRRGRDELNETRRRLGLRELPWVHNGLSHGLCLVGTLPALEYPRRWEPWEHVVGPLQWELPFEDVEPPAGDEPLVVVAPSTSQDRDHVLLRAALRGLEGLPVRVLATWNRRPPDSPLPRAGNARVVEWMAYSKAMARADVVVCHGGHGTVVRSLSCGAAVVVCPAAGDMNENAARVDWAGLGVRIPRRWATARSVRLAVLRALGDQGIAGRVRAVADWARANDGALRAAELVEGVAAPPGQASSTPTTSSISRLSCQPPPSASRSEDRITPTARKPTFS
jgi:UDP:flavonoid glycosyltransferase YjiC (YdhE family)